MRPLLIVTCDYRHCLATRDVDLTDPDVPFPSEQGDAYIADGPFENGCAVCSPVWRGVPCG